MVTNINARPGLALFPPLAGGWFNCSVVVETDLLMVGCTVARRCCVESEA